MNDGAKSTPYRETKEGDALTTPYRETKEGDALTTPYRVPSCTIGETCTSFNLAKDQVINTEHLKGMH